VVVTVVVDVTVDVAGVVASATWREGDDAPASDAAGAPGLAASSVVVVVDTDAGVLAPWRPMSGRAVCPEP
jgi:hypothetical protein